MRTFLLSAGGVFLALASLAAYTLWRRRDWFVQMLADKLTPASRIPLIALPELDSRFAATGRMPSLEAEVYLIGGSVVGGTTDTESWILSVLAKSATRMFEFGTATGRTAYLWARNSEPSATVVTLNLPPDPDKVYVAAEGDSVNARNNALYEGHQGAFCYIGTPVEHKITQLLADSKSLDADAFEGQFDLVFVDGSHAYSYVKSDSEKALRMLRPGGVILWHDYRPGPNTGDVKRYLDSRLGALPLRRIADTTFVVYRSVAQYHA